MTPRQYGLMCEGWGDARGREWQQEQVNLHLLRFIGATLHNIGAGFSKNGKAIKPSDLAYLPMYDDRESAPEGIDRERWKRIVKRDKRTLPDGFTDRDT